MRSVDYCAETHMWEVGHADCRKDSAGLHTWVALEASVVSWTAWFNSTAPASAPSAAAIAASSRQTRCVMSLLAGWLTLSSNLVLKAGGCIVDRVKGRQIGLTSTVWRVPYKGLDLLPCFRLQLAPGVAYFTEN